MANLGGIASNSEVTADGLIITDDQTPPHRWRLRIIQTGGATGGGTIGLSLLGALIPARSIGATGTISLEITDLGT